MYKIEYIRLVNIRFQKCSIIY